MIDDVKRLGFEQVLQRGVPNIQLVENGLGIDIFLVSRGKVVDDHHMMPGCDIRICNMGPYKTRPSGH